MYYKFLVWHIRNIHKFIKYSGDVIYCPLYIALIQDQALKKRALTATMTVLRDIKIAPIAGVSSNP